MIFKKIKSEGLAHFSYFIGDQNEAAVIDPRRDIDVYLEEAKKAGVKIKYIFETHRNEDYIIGSRALAAASGAEIFHAEAELDYQYGNLVDTKRDYKVGSLTIKALHTPGHTKGSHSYLLKEADGSPWILFSGDILLAGDVGRIDFYGKENIPEIASLLYDSLYKKILPLGEGVVLAPAHGAGSVCGSEIAERELTTLGIEKRKNPYLQFNSKEKFVAKVGKMEEKPGYFQKMEAENLKLTRTNQLPFVPALTPSEFEEKMTAENTTVIDIRNNSSYAASHISNSLFLEESILAGFVGWFLDDQENIILLTDGDYPEKAVRTLYRMGYENISGYLGEGILSWHIAGKYTASTSIINVQRLCKILDSSSTSEYILLDIRREEEKEDDGYISGSEGIVLTELEAEIDQYSKELDQVKDIYIFCGSGMRSMTAASLLENKVEAKVNVILGGLNAWSSSSCPVK